MTDMQLSVGDIAPDVEVLDKDGIDVRTAALWSTRPVALFFLRHFG